MKNLGLARNVMMEIIAESGSKECGVPQVENERAQAGVTCDTNFSGNKQDWQHSPDDAQSAENDDHTRMYARPYTHTHTHRVPLVASY